MTLEIVAAVDVSLEQQAAAMNDAFTGYIAGDIHMNTSIYAGFLARDGIDLTLSRFLLRDGVPVALGLIARRGWSSRLAAMGVIRAAQEGGLGRYLLDDLVLQARQRGDRIFWLECFEQNTRGIRLYSGVGFEIIQRLYGYNRARLGEDVPPEEADFEMIDPAIVGEMVVKHGAEALPWQLSGATIAQFGPPFVGVQREGAYALITSGRTGMISLLSLVVPEAQRNQGRAARLVQSLIAHHPDKSWRVPQMCPEAVGGFFEKQGFGRNELHQVQMRLDLTKSTEDAS